MKALSKKVLQYKAEKSRQEYAAKRAERLANMTEEELELEKKRKEALKAHMDMIGGIYDMMKSKPYNE